jgi:aspartyl-tRNA(Asn)/glutamyl-tRNA(Gln) amidotransferase subunit A
MELHKLTITEALKGLREGAFTSVALTQALIDVMEASQADIHAYVTIDAAGALAQAAECDKRRAAGEDLPLLGVPIAIKDNMNVIGQPCTASSRILEGYVAPYDATVIAKLRAAGAVFLGRTNMDEFALGSTTQTSGFGPTENPVARGCIPGGSSGGSAAAVGGDLAICALGSDTGGSIRQPAGFCGVVGMKPTYGAVSRYGVVAFGSSLDQVGPFGRSVSDVALAMNALVAGGRDPLDSTSQEVSVDFLAQLEDPVEGMRVGVIPALMEHEGITDEVRSGLDAARAALEDQGVQIVEVDLPNIASAIAAYYVIGPSEAFSNLARFDGVRFGYQEPGCATLAEQTALSRAHGFGAEAKRRQMLGAYLLAAGVYDKYYYPAQQVRTLITADYRAAFERCDAIMLPTAPTTAWRFGEVSDPTQMYAYDLFTISNNIAGNGGISVPVGSSAQAGMPLAAQLQGPAFADRKLLRVARAVERGIAARGLFMPGTVAPTCAGQGGELA